MNYDCSIECIHDGAASEGALFKKKIKIFFNKASGMMVWDADVCFILYPNLHSFTQNKII